MAAYRNQPSSQRLRTGRTLASLNPGTSDTSLHACNPYGLRGPPQTPCQPGGEVVTDGTARGGATLCLRARGHRHRHRVPPTGRYRSPTR
jgi:hypothetical protein